MYKVALGGVLSGLLVAGCVAKQPDVVEVPMYQACKEVPPKVVEVPVPVPMACQLNDPEPTMTTTRGKKGKVQRVKSGGGMGVLDGKTSNKVQTHPYMPGALYTVQLGKTNTTMILLQPGEVLGPYVAGDKERWELADIQTGSPEGIRPAVVVSCKMEDTQTNLNITTNKRVYLLQLYCTLGSYHALVSWDYPGEGNKMQLVTPAATVPEAAPMVQPLPDPERRNYDYEVKLRKGDAPPWMPQAVYDNGQQTVIEFPQDMTTGDAPVLYLRTAENTQSVVNYRTIAGGTMYQVDRLFDHAELVQGEKKPIIVTIKRTGRKS